MRGSTGAGRGLRPASQRRRARAQSPARRAPRSDRVSVICTVRNEAKSLEPLLRSLAAQARPADEVVLCDGGSNDFTARIAGRYRSRLRLRFLVSKGANIARGRNIAIRAAKSPLIATIDGGCVADPQWLAELLATRHRTGADVVAGTFTPLAQTPFGRVAGALLCPDPKKLPDDWPPSSRSALFTKAAWSAVGGYPEHLYTAEDTTFNRSLKAAGFRYALARSAVVQWQQRETPRALWKQFFLYGRGDGQVREFSGYNGIRTLAAVAGMGLFWALFLGSLILSPLLAWILLLAFLFSLFFPAWKLSFLSPRDPSVLLYAPAVQAIRRTAFFCGFLRGLALPRTGIR